MQNDLNTHTHTQTHSNLNYGCKLGEGGDAGGGWRQLKWKSRTDQYCWRFSSLHSPLNCHAPSKQLKALCLSFSIYPLSFFLSFPVYMYLPVTSFFHIFLLCLSQSFITTLSRPSLSALILW